MTTNDSKPIIAALDNSEAALTVAQTAAALGALLHRPARAIHIREDGTRTANAAAERCGLPFEARDGAVIEALLDAAAHAAIMVLGSKDRPAPGDPIGHVARALMVQVATPIVVIPPGTVLHAHPPAVLIPIDGSDTSAPTLDSTLALFGEADCARTAMFVFDEPRLPAFADHAHHETEAWTREFQRRHLGSTDLIDIELRVGSPVEQVLEVAAEQHATLIAVGWSQHLDPGRAHNVRALIERSSVPLLLLPVGS
jgi:nucleotide-binding universal stress UspA family protein